MPVQWLKKYRELLERLERTSENQAQRLLSQHKLKGLLRAYFDVAGT
jgi:hypothetical protein